MSENDIIGKRFDRWTIIQKINKKDELGRNRTYVLCECDCEYKTQKLIRYDIVKSGQSRSCGCLNREFMSEMGKSKKKFNQYDLTKEYGIGFASNTNKQFYFDKEDYDKLKNYTWLEDKDGYIWSNNGGNPIRLHRFLLNVINKTQLIDHRNRIKHDNRKNNLKIASYFENNHNFGRQSNNKTGKKGVHEHTKCGYNAQITYKGSVRRKHFTTLEKAIEQRKKWEMELFGYYFDN